MSLEGIGVVERAAERSERSERREAALAAVGHDADPEVAPTAKRRRFCTQYKLRILEEAERCDSYEQMGLLLRREGLYSWHIRGWRRWRNNAMKERKPNRKKAQGVKELCNENARLKRENRRLQLKLKRAEGLIELQKKVAQMLEQPEDEMNGSGS